MKSLHRRPFAPAPWPASPLRQPLSPRALLLLLALVLLLAPRPARAAPAANGSFVQRCERDMLSTIEVRTLPRGFVVHNGVSSRVLNTRATYALAADATMGLTASRTRAEISVSGPTLLDPASARECLAARIEIELSYQPLDVYVAREFHPESCSYREVFAHEMQHVTLYADSLPAIEQRVRAELARLHGARPLYAPRDKGVAMLYGQIESWLPALIREELAKVEARQRALDDIDETTRLSRLCQGEVAFLMGSSL